MSRLKAILTPILSIVCILTFAGTKDDVAKSIVRVHSGAKYSTGFWWGDGSRIITTLHALSDTKNIEIYIPSLNKWEPVSLIKSYKDGDLVMLKTSTFVSVNYLNQKYNTQPPVDTKSFTIGYYSGNNSYQDRDFSVGLLQGNTLKDLLPSSAEKELTSLGFPNLNIKIVYLNGNLLHGFSGAPIVDNYGKLIGIADGGLENGAAGISWCIDASAISKLESSLESIPVLNQNKINTLFAGEEYEDNFETTTFDLNGFTFSKIKTRTFAELDATGNYSTFREMGLDQLLTMFLQSGINYNEFEYDIYLEETTGATLVIPAGLNLYNDGNFLRCISNDGDFNFYIKIENTNDVQSTSVNFESAIMNATQKYNWMPDARLSFLSPLYRPDYVVINRKAFYTIDFVKYGFEALAAKTSTFFGVFVAIENQFNPMTTGFNNATEVAKYNLALQLTTFSN